MGMIESKTLLNRSPVDSRSGLSRTTTVEYPPLNRIPFVETPIIDPSPVVEPARSAWQPMELGRYRVTIAETLAEREAACRLRFKVFNIELGEGLQTSYKTGLDTDHFDLFCDQLIVEDRNSRSIVGTYRMQTGTTAARNLGYYSEQEFDFSPYESLREWTLELGRASIDREHRSSEVLTLLWRGIAKYTRIYNLRYLIGCSSLNSQDPKIGWQMCRQLSDFMVGEEFRTAPTAAYTLPYADEAPEIMAKVPKLLRTYIGIGAKICGSPAWDREFGTIDFLTLLDMRELTPAARVRFLTEAQ
jgi:putative hemolysin